jgi:hypothetical protein
MSSYDYPRRISIVFWIFAVITIPFWALHDAPGWDIVFYRNAIVSLHAGHDPYADAIAVQDEFHRNLAQHPNAQVPYSYVYSPITLPLLRLIGILPFAISLPLYWLVLIAGVVGTLWVLSQSAQASAEKAFLRIVLPLLIFCPGLLAHDTLFSGNVAFILYGAVLLGASIGWRRNQWIWCYLAIFIASCFKAPLLCLVAVPLLSARRQWIPAVSTIAASVALFALQPVIWPSLFHNFLRAVELQFSYNRDFGSSPAGVFSSIIVHYGIRYSPASEVVYLLYAAVIVVTLFHLSRQFLDGKFALKQWMPVLILGAILLNPRIMEYDAAPLAIPMALIGWRFFTRRLTTLPAALTYLAFFLVANCFAVGRYATWKPIECLLLVGLFTIGCWDLLHPLPVIPAAVPSTRSQHL